jgi:hypothetical protein
MVGPMTRTSGFGNPMATVTMPAWASGLLAFFAATKAGPTQT